MSDMLQLVVKMSDMRLSCRVFEYGPICFSLSGVNNEDLKCIQGRKIFRPDKLKHIGPYSKT